MRTSTKVKPRERLLATAADLFYREGIHAVSIDRLCEEARVSKRSLYQYFDNKDAILTEMLERRGAEILALYLPAEDDDRPPLERILAVFDSQQSLARSPEFFGCPFVNVAAELKDRAHPASALAGSFKLDLTRFFERQAVLAGATMPAMLATQLTMLFDGACAHAVMQGGIPDAAKSAAAALITGACVRSAE